MQTSTYISPNVILANVLPNVDDVRMEDASKGYYISAIQKAIEAVALESLFDEKVESYLTPKNLIMDMPQNMINMISMYVHDGDKCDFSVVRKVWYKRNYITRGQGYLAYDRGAGTNDPFYGNRTNIVSKYEDKGLVGQSPSTSNLLWYNIQGGKIMVSPACAKFKNIALIFNGTGCAIDDEPIIPIQFRTFVEDYVCEHVLRAKMAKDSRKWAPIWKVYESRLNAPFIGSFDKAVNYTRRLTVAQRNDMHEYLGRH